MRQILTRFMQDDGLYFQEFLPFFPNLKNNYNPQMMILLINIGINLLDQRYGYNNMEFI